LEAEALELLTGQPLRLSFADILAHPRLPEARRAYIDDFLRVYHGDPFLIRLVLEAGRFLVFHIAAVLDAGQDLSRRETWFTVSALKQQLALYGFASGRQVDHLVRRLQSVGFISERRHPADGRVRLLAITEKLRTHHQDWLAAHFAPLVTLYPHHDYGPILARDARFHIVHCRTCLPYQPVAARLMMTIPDTMLFFSHSAGPLIMNAVIKAAMDSKDPGADVPYIDAADRFGVSSTHVRTMMQTAEAAGLVRISGRGGRNIAILPRFWDSYDRGLALGMYLHDAHNIVAMRAWRQEVAAAPSADALSGLSADNIQAPEVTA
jgi:hypothetical protein